MSYFYNVMTIVNTFKISYHIFYILIGFKYYPSVNFSIVCFTLYYVTIHIMGHQFLLNCILVNFHHLIFLLGISWECFFLINNRALPQLSMLSTKFTVLVSPKPASLFQLLAHYYINIQIWDGFISNYFVKFLEKIYSNISTNINKCTKSDNASTISSLTLLSYVDFLCLH